MSLQVRRDPVGLDWKLAYVLGFLYFVCGVVGAAKWWAVRSNPSIDGRHSAKALALFFSVSMLISTVATFAFGHALDPASSGPGPLGLSRSAAVAEVAGILARGAWVAFGLIVAFTVHKRLIAAILVPFVVSLALVVRFVLISRSQRLAFYWGLAAEARAAVALCSVYRLTQASKEPSNPRRAVLFVLAGALLHLAALGMAAACNAGAACFTFGYPSFLTVYFALAIVALGLAAYGPPRPAPPRHPGPTPLAPPRPGPDPPRPARPAQAPPRLLRPAHLPRPASPRPPRPPAPPRFAAPPRPARPRPAPR
eukprot:tig00000624_g2655.t1